MRKLSVCLIYLILWHRGAPTFLQMTRPTLLQGSVALLGRNAPFSIHSSSDHRGAGSHLGSAVRGCAMSTSVRKGNCGRGGVSSLSFQGLSMGLGGSRSLLQHSPVPHGSPARAWPWSVAAGSLLPRLARVPSPVTVLLLRPSPVQWGPHFG